MRRYRFDSGLGPVFRMPKVASSWRGSSWVHTTKAFKALHLQCAKCGAISDLECGRTFPKHQGGSDDWSNLQSLCKACHALKSAVFPGAGYFVESISASRRASRTRRSSVSSTMSSTMSSMRASPTGSDASRDKPETSRKRGR